MPGDLNSDGSYVVRKPAELQKMKTTFAGEKSMADSDVMTPG